LKSKRTKKLTAPAVILLLAGSLSAQTSAQISQKQTSQKPAAHHAAKTHKVSHRPGKKSRRPRGQMAIDGERASQIQAALVREHYMNGEPSGKWDDSTQAALRRYQADQGWQSKSIPDSRALIRLGLGPDHVHLLNPESAMVSEPQLTGRTRSAAPVARRPAVPAPASTPVAVPATTVPNISSGR
jgi:peptidoglycan hydrolase-like protein with peptidoglycan-binding domain